MSKAEGKSYEGITQAIGRLGIRLDERCENDRSAMRQLWIFINNSIANRLVIGNHELLKMYSFEKRRDGAVEAILLKPAKTPAAIARLPVLCEGIGCGREELYCHARECVNQLLGEADPKKAIAIAKNAYAQLAIQLNDEQKAFDFFSELSEEAKKAQKGTVKTAIMNVLADRLVENEDFGLLEKYLLERKIELKIPRMLELCWHVVEYLKTEEEYKKAASFMLEMFYRKENDAKLIYSRPANKENDGTDAHYVNYGFYVVYPITQKSPKTANKLRKIFKGIFDGAKEQGISLGSTPMLTDIWLKRLPKK